MYLSILEFVLILIVKDDAVLLNKAHYRGLPPGALQEIDNDIEEPVLILIVNECG
jgi:hypothetical protein